MPAFESATVLVLVKTGSRYEEKRTNGIAHFAEHMFFKGTKKRPSALDISTLIDGIGGEFNAFTSKEYTGYYIKGAARHLDLILDVLSDMLLNSKFDQAEIDRERGVINEELRMYLDTPMRHIGDVFEELLYGDQPLGWDTVGTLDSLKNINHRQFLEYLKRYYHPSNMVATIAGGVSAQIAHEKIEKFFGSMLDEKAKGFLPVKVSQQKPAIKLQFKETEQAHLAIGVRSYPRGHENRYKSAVLGSILGASMSSRLFIQLRERRGLAYYVRASSEEYADSGYFAANAGVEPKNTEEAVKVILEELKKIGQEKVSAEELKKAKEYIKGKLVLETEDSRDVAGMFGMQMLLENKIRTTDEIIKNIDAVTAEGVREAASDIFKTQTLNLAVIGPFKEEEKFAKILKL